MIYRQFANDPNKFYISNTSHIQPTEVTIGVDFGGNKSGHAFVASGHTYDFKTLYALASKRYVGEYTPQQVDNLLIKFVQEVINKYGKVDYIYYDNAEPVLGRGIKQAIQKLFPSISVRGAYKMRVNDRIACLVRLLGADRFKINPACETLIEALKTAMYNNKSMEDERLDDGSSDIDSMDAFEYSYERYIKNYMGVL